MSETPQSTEAADGGAAEAATAAPATPRRGPHRGTDPREAIAELTLRAHEISQDAGNKMAGAMRDVINAAAGLAGFAVESARDLIQYMVRRGQMSPQEGEKLLRQAEEAAARRPKPAAEPSRAERRSAGDGEPPQKESPRAAKASAKEPAKEPAPKSAAKAAAKASPATAPDKAATKSAARSARTDGAARASAKSAAKSGARATTKSAAKPAAKKSPAKSAKKAAPAAGAKKKAPSGKTAAKKSTRRK